MGSSWRQWLWAWGLGKGPIVDPEFGWVLTGSTYGVWRTTLGLAALYVNGGVPEATGPVFVLPPDEGGRYRIGWDAMGGNLPQWPWYADAEPCRNAIPAEKWWYPWGEEVWPG